MIVHVELAKELYLSLESLSRVSKLKVSQEQFVKWFTTINRWNALPVGKVFDATVEYSDYVIPAKLRDIVDPQWISLTGNNTERNLAFSDDGYAETYKDILSVEAFNRVSNAINGAMKWEQSVVNVQQLRKSQVALTDAAKRDSFNGMVRNTEQAFVPLNTKANAFYDDEVYCKKSDSMFTSWFENTLRLN